MIKTTVEQIASRLARLATGSKKGPQIPSPRILFQIYNRRGLGHFVRSQNIASQIIKHQPGAEVLFCVRNDFKLTCPSFDIKYVVESDQKWNSTWHHVVESFQPNVIVYDTMIPRDSDFDQVDRTAKLVYIMRKCKPERQQEIFASSFLQVVDLVLVPHNEKEFSCAIPESIAQKTVFVGAIVRQPNLAVIEQLKRQYDLNDNSFVLVSTLGGGGFQTESDRFFKMVFDVHQQLMRKMKNLRHIVIQGPNYQGGLKSMDAMTIVEWEPALVSLFSLADLVISAGGYNTVNEIRTTKTPAIFLPSPRTHDDQHERVQDLADSGLAVVITDQADEKSAAKISAICLCEQTINSMKKRYRNDSQVIGNAAASEAILELASR